MQTPTTPTAGLLPLIGNTPMVQVTRLDTGPCELFLKLESHNPGGSIKDRIGLSMIEAAERDGKLGSHQPELIEATAGNTGLALALVSAQKGYRLTLVIPDKMSQEKVFHLKALGAQVIMTRSDVAKGHPEYYQDVAARLAKERNMFFVNQFENPANPQAHEQTTGPEILAQLNGKIDAMVVGVGSGGTLTGLSRCFAEHAPDCELVLADPVGSILVDYITKGSYGQAGSWVIEGIGEDFIPKICDLSRVKRGYSIPDAESLQTARALLLKEGILGGSSSGTLLAAALRYCREQSTPKRVCTLVCDSGNKYLSKMFNDYWMRDHGFVTRETYGDLRDVISRSQEERAVITIGPEDTLLLAYGRMKLYDVSQLPVVDEKGKVIGLVDESDLLLATMDDQRAGLQRKIREVMSTALVTVAPNVPLKELMPLFDRGIVPLVMHEGEFCGLITKIDVLNHLRRQAH